MAKFYFCLATGVGGYQPDQQDYIAADTAVDAFDAIVAAIQDFQQYNNNDMARGAWSTSFERACKYPDASMWNFTVAFDGNTGTGLSVVGMTEDEYIQNS